MLGIVLAAAALGYSSGGGPDSVGQTCDAIDVCPGGACPVVSDFVVALDVVDVLTSL